MKNPVLSMPKLASTAAANPMSNRPDYVLTHVICLEDIFGANDMSAEEYLNRAINSRLKDLQKRLSIEIMSISYLTKHNHASVDVYAFINYRISANDMAALSL